MRRRTTETQRLMPLPDGLLSALCCLAVRRNLKLKRTKCGHFHGRAFAGMTTLLEFQCEALLCRQPKEGLKPIMLDCTASLKKLPFFFFFANIHPAAMHLWRKSVGLPAGHFAYLDTTCREDEMIIYDFDGGIIRGNM